MARGSNGPIHFTRIDCWDVGTAQILPPLPIRRINSYKNELERTPGLTIPCFTQSAHPSAASLRAPFIAAHC